MVARPECSSWCFGCNCGDGPCIDQRHVLIQQKSRVEMWLAIGIAISLCAVIFSIGYLALERAERQYQLEARV
ncbi:MAG: hypothetical protein BGO05_10100 [Rhizobiales bacterium 63-7]|nr:hypothetical protein [Hyphomicrobiales bacterium]OJU66191.1 MAG: hypothetical protein BGO05_10100 [Rhizobiales bacterium 63-7]